MVRRLLRAAALLAGAAGLAVAWTLPLVTAPASQILGAGAGDNVTFLWNVWWMRRALADPALDFFFCPLIFAPWGTTLVLHTHTALPAFAGATLFGALPLVLAQNVIIWAALAANACAMYALALDRTRDRGAALVAALVFAGSPFVVARLHGHWNLIHLWPLPLVVLAAGRALTGGRAEWWAAVTGALLALALYTDYYIAVYAGALFLLVSADRLMTMHWTIGPTRWTPVALTCAAAAGAAFAAALVIVVSGGGSFTISSWVVSARTATNPLRAGWIAAILTAVVLWKPRLRIGWRDSVSRGAALRVLAMAGAVCVVAAAPILWHGAALIAAGEYVGEGLRWRSAPRGVDLLTLALGSPWHPLTGGWTRGVYERLGIDPVEQIGWMGIVPVALAAIALRHRRGSDGARRLPTVRWAWLWIGAVVWSLGPFLTVAGVEAGLPLPQIVQRFVPVVASARMPGRVMAVAFLALAMLAAFAVVTLRERLRPRAREIATAAAGLALLADFWPAPHPVLALNVPAIYADVAALRSGPVVELPLGIRDGFGETGRLDHRTLYFQTAHGRPVSGGFVARLPPALEARHEAEPVIGSLLKLSAGLPLTAGETARDRRLAPARLREWNMQVFVVRTGEAPRELVAYLRTVLGAERVSGDGEREVYVVGGPAFPR